MGGDGPHSRLAAKSVRAPVDGEPVFRSERQKSAGGRPPARVADVQEANLPQLDGVIGEELGSNLEGCVQC